MAGLVPPLRLVFALAFSLVLGSSGCRFDEPDFTGTQYRCPDQHCPDGFTCGGDGWCHPIGDAGSPDGPPAIDAAIDAADAAADATPPADALGVCDQAALADDNDGCGYAIEVADGATVYGDTTDYGSGLLLPNLECTGKNTAGPDAFYQIDLVAGAHLIATMTPEDWDGGLYLVDSCSPASCVAGSDVATVNLAETVDVEIGSAGTYYLVVEGAILSQFGCFTLTVSVTGP